VIVKDGVRLLEWYQKNYYCHYYTTLLAIFILWTVHSTPGCIVHARVPNILLALLPPAVWSHEPSYRQPVREDRFPAMPLLPILDGFAP
jgi:hypothetical protein